jgi:hypothetical protein
MLKINLKKIKLMFYQKHNFLKLFLEWGVGVT